MSREGLPARRERTQWEVVAFLAFIGMSAAFGIDASLPAFDEMRPDVGLPPGSNRITLAITVYFLGMAGGQIVYGPLSDRFGRMATLRVGMAIYAVGAAGSMLATDFGFLLGSRLVWGLGASAASLMNLAILRDLYSGTRMARMMSLVTAVFLAGPVVTPLAAEGILRAASWRWIYACGLVLAVAIVTWSLRFGETLHPDNRRPLRVGPTVDAFRQVVTCRRTVLYAATLLFVDGAFLIFLGSTQQVFDIIYGRADQFAFLFAASAIPFAIGFLLVSPAIGRWGAHRVGLAVLSAALALAVALLGLTLAADGVPEFWTWFSFMVVGNTLLALVTPVAMSMALEPMGDLAGTAAGILGLGGITAASLLAAFVGIHIHDSTTPWAVGYVVYGAIGL
ncbi:MAG: MFS transporter, partial [Acidimicrobiaceae bacterium]|nr:MFS transporter [Acidimicrobiaceae bacterium]